ncbi:MAG: choice-of-anchor L domain-containing protein [Labilithrix sp.]|nr:choice-of-anchor L domain-containing protein [Labilithrix sp.]
MSGARPIALALVLAAACGEGARSSFDPEAEAGAPPASFGDAASTCVPDPANFDVPGNGCDDDGDGVVDNTPTCDADLPVFSDAAGFARALGVCKGLRSATFTRGHGATTPPADGQHGILPAFGKVIRPREGARLGVLSTGWARPYDDVQATSCDPATLTHCFKQGVQMQNGAPTPGGAPPGYPKAVGSCAVSDQVFDAISVKLAIEVPKNARGFSLDFDFYSGEWPDYVCTRFNDAFVMWLSSSAFNGGVPENVAFDAAQRPLSVNSAFFDRCTVGTQTGCKGQPPIFQTSTCGGDLSELEETGFYAPGLYCNGQLSTGGGATGWLTTQAAVTPGEVMSLELLIWDTGDPKFDSTVLVDRFVWLPDDTQTSTTRLR